jgi:hypothetical protein
MTQQTPVIIEIRENWGGPGFSTLISDRKTAYAVGFHERGDFIIHACKTDGNYIEYDHDPDRGIAINLDKSTYEVWGLNPRCMSTIYSLLELNGEGKAVMNLREKLADLEHTQWAHWTRYMLQNMNLDNITRWQKQIETPYASLTEEEKDSDRVWADRVLECMLDKNRGKK